MGYYARYDPMYLVARFLAIAALVFLVPAAPTAVQSIHATPDSLAARLLAASEQQRAELLTREEFATADVVRELIAPGETERLVGEFIRAHASFEAAATVAKRIGADRELGRALNGFADALFRQFEGIVGTMWALFVAGAQTTLVWKVESTSTTELMTAFHRGVAASGSKAVLLRNATLEVVRTPRYAHPFYWAPFILVGNPY